MCVRKREREITPIQHPHPKLLLNELLEELCLELVRLDHMDLLLAHGTLALKSLLLGGHDALAVR